MSRIGHAEDCAKHRGHPMHYGGLQPAACTCDALDRANAEIERLEGELTELKAALIKRAQDWVRNPTQRSPRQVLELVIAFVDRRIKRAH